MVKIETVEVFSAAINDVEKDITEKSDAALLDIAVGVKREYESTNGISLHALTEKYGIKETIKTLYALYILSLKNTTENIKIIEQNIVHSCWSSNKFVI